MDKIPLDLKRLTITYLISVLVIIIVLALSFFKIFFMEVWGMTQFLSVGLVIVLSVIFYIVTIKNNYYTINNNSIIVKKYTKEIEYSFSSMIYIDEELSLKKKKLIFYGEKSKEVYLPFDKEMLIYTTALKKAKNRLSKEEFNQKYPNVRF